MDAKDQQTLLLAMYKENCDQARHHELLRERVTTLLATTTALILGLFGFSSSWTNPVAAHLAIPVFLVVLGLWGFLASWKHNERSKLHVQRVRKIREQLTQICGIDLAGINAAAESQHKKDFGRSRLSDSRTHIIWKTFPILITAIGLAVLVYLLWKLGGFSSIQIIN